MKMAAIDIVNLVILPGEEFGTESTENFKSNWSTLIFWIWLTFKSISKIFHTKQSTYHCGS